VELAEAMNRLRVGAYDQVTQIDARLVSRPLRRDVHDQETMFLFGSGTGAPLRWQRNFLHGDAKVSE
jgi:hypothetical protein